MTDIRRDVATTIKRLCANPCDILLVSAASFFRSASLKANISETVSEARSRAGALLMGDQDYEPCHVIFQLKSLLCIQHVRAHCIDLNVLYYLVQKNVITDDPLYLYESVLQATAPRVIAISAMRPNLSEAIRCADIAQRILPTAAVVLGGPAALAPKQLLGQFTYILNTTSLLSAANTLRKIADLKTAIPSNASQLSDFVFPDYSDLPVELPLIPRIFTSYGCSAGCEFCAPAAVLNFKVQISDASRSMNCIKAILANYDVNYFLIGDLTFFINNKSAQRLLVDLSDECIRPWWCQTQARLLRSSAVAALRKAGCRQLAFGVEDLSTGNLAIRRKNSGYNCTVESLYSLKSAGIETQTYWMFGLPDDTETRCEERITAMEELITRRLVDCVHLSYLMPYPGTPIGDRPNLYGIRIISTFEAHYREAVGDFYSPPPIHDTKNMTSQQIHEWFLKAREVVSGAFTRATGN